MKQRKNGNGYLIVGLRVNDIQVTYRVHRLVAEAYLEKPFENATVNHIDGNKENNNVSNLEWISLKDNIIHSYKLGLASRGENRTQAKLCDSDVEVIKIGFMQKLSNVELAAMYNISSAVISDIRSHKTWNHIRPDLEWDIGATRSKLTSSDIPLIREAISAGLDDPSIGKIYGVHRTTIRHIRLGNTWTNY